MKLPQAWTNAGQQSAVTANKVEARVDMSADVAGKGKCPVCQRPMEDVVISGSRMWACASDRITLPIPDEDHGN
jgi:hypothetical protein